jgi:hypothetical protein
MKKHYFTLVFVVFFALGCSVINQIKKGIDDVQKPKVVTAVDGKCQLTVPGTWREDKELHDQATLQVSNRFSELYVVVLTNNKADFTDEMDIDTLTQALRKDMSGNVNQAESGNPISISIDGNPARQFEMSGAVEGIKAKYIYTVVDAPQNYYQIISWTLASRYESNKSKLLEVVDSFKETSGKQSAPPPPAKKSNSKSF